MELRREYSYYTGSQTAFIFGMYYILYILFICQNLLSKARQVIHILYVGMSGYEPITY